MALPANETFTASDGTLVNALSNWTGSDSTDGDGPQIFSNAATGFNPTRVEIAYWDADSFDAAQYSEAVIITIASGAYCGVGVRMAGTPGSGNITGYMFYSDSGDGCYVDKYVNGSYIGTLAGPGSPFATNDLIRLEIDGNAITAKVNGTTRLSVTDNSSPISSGAAGIAFYDNGSSSIDDWEGGNLAAPPEPDPPTVTTQAVTDIAITTATGNGNVTDDGGATVTERGVVANTSGTPTTSDLKFTAASGGTGAFTAGMTGLDPDTHYYVRAYAINSEGTAYGSQVEFDTDEHTVTGGATAALAGSGAKVVEHAVTGGAVSSLVGSGAKVVEHVKTGGATAALLGGGTKIWEVAKTGGAVAALTGSGARASEYTETGGATSQLTGSGAAGADLIKSGEGSIATVGSGAKVREVSDTGGATMPLVGSGAKVREVTKTGGAVSTFVGSGGKATEHTATGGAVSTLIGSGLSIHELGGSEIIKAGGAISTLIGSGLSIHELGGSEIIKAGGAISTLIGSGARALEYIETGGATSTVVGAGLTFVEYSKSGGAIVTLWSSGETAVEYAKSGGATAYLSGGGVFVEGEPPIIGNFNVLLGDASMIVYVGDDNQRVYIGEN